MMISLITDYTLFGAIDDQMIEILFIDIGKENKEKISENLLSFKETMVKREQSGE